MVAGCGYEFRQYRLDARARLLFRNGQRVVLTPKAVDLLIALVQAEGEPVGRQELLRRVWPDTLVEDGSLTSHVFLLRRVLGAPADGQQFIETIPKRGYRFVGPCAQIAAPETASQPSRVMLVVVPFENLSGGRKHDYFSEGLSEEMISQLARLNPQQLGVIARTSAIQYKAAKKSIGEIAAELHVDCVLEGSVRSDGRRLRITGQLIEARDQTHLWSASYDRDLRDVLDVQTDVARQIGKAVALELLSG